MGTIIVDYLLAILIDKNRHEEGKCKSIFILAIILNVSILGFFKYFGFFVDNINSIFHLNIPFEGLALPIGISFYTFQVLSYIVDVYLGKVEVQYNIINFAIVI